MNPDPIEAGVLLFGERRLPRALRGLPVRRMETADPRQQIDDAARRFGRLIVVGDDADLAAVLTRLLRIERLGVQVGYAPRRRSAATRAYRLPTGHRAARRARAGAPEPVPLIRDDAGAALVGAAAWLPADERARLRGEGIVDDEALFDGEVSAVRIEPTMTGLRAGVSGPGGRRVRRWVGGRAAQLGTTGAVVLRDGDRGARSVKRSTFYRHVADWLLVR